jgi:hypothetical protein
MNQFYNPMFLSKILKTYLFDIDRLNRLDDKSLKKYQDKCLKKIVKYAYTVPLYHDKYKDKVKGVSKVITTPITYIATSNAIVTTNLKPAYVDIERTTYNITPENIKEHLEKITGKKIELREEMPEGSERNGLY